MRTSSCRGIVVALILATAPIAPIMGPTRVVAGEERPTPPRSRSSVLTAFNNTRERGVPTILIVTSHQVPASKQFWESFSTSDWVRRQRGLIQVVTTSLEDDPKFIAALKVTQFPAAVAYVVNTSGLASYQTTRDCKNVNTLTNWLDRLVDTPKVAGPSAPPVDTEVSRTMHGHHEYPSSQSPIPPSPPQPVPAAPQIGMTAQPAVATFSPQMATTASANVISVPSQNFVIQQQAPQVFMAPAQAPVVYVPQQAQTMAVASMPAAAPAMNMFLPAGGVAAPASAPAMMAGAPVAPAMSLVASAPTMGFAPAPTMALATAPNVGVAAVPPTGVAGIAAVATQPSQLAAVTNQQLNLATSDARTRVRIRGAGPVRSSLARFGERLSALGRTRIETVQETTLESPMTQAGAPGLTTISTTSAVPLPPREQPVVAIPANAPAPPAPVVEVQGERPSPQSIHHHDKHH